MDPSIIQNLSEQDKALLSKVLSMPTVGKALGIPKDRPPRRDNSPYYSATSAESIKPIADTMIEDKTDVYIRYALYPGWKPNTIRTKLYKASQYLSDYDTTPDQRYKDWYSRVEFQGKGDEGTLITWATEIVDENFNRFDKVPSALYGPKPSPHDWRPELIKFLGDPERKNLKIDELQLTDEDIKFIDTLLEGAEVVKEVSPNQIIVIKGKFGV